MANIKTKVLEPGAIEHGYDFISLYFPTLNEANEYAARLFRKFKRINFEHLDLQRQNFRHLPGDPEHFHSDGDAKDYLPDMFRHFHIIYPGKPSEQDWEYLYKHCNDINLKIRLKQNLPIREVR